MVILKRLRFHGLYQRRQFTMVILFPSNFHSPTQDQWPAPWVSGYNLQPYPFPFPPPHHCQPALHSTLHHMLLVLIHSCYLFVITFALCGAGEVLRERRSLSYSQFPTLKPSGKGSGGGQHTDGGNWKGNIGLLELSQLFPLPASLVTK